MSCVYFYVNRKTCKRRNTRQELAWNELTSSAYISWEAFFYCSLKRGYIRMVLSPYLLYGVSNTYHLSRLVQLGDKINDYRLKYHFHTYTWSPRTFNKS